MPASAFISYSRDDSEFALRLAQDLKNAGASVWIDQLDIEPGAAWDNAIEDALIASPRMLLVLSPGSARSQNVRNEISFALEQGKAVIPVLYKDCVVPLQLQRNNRIDFRADYARGLASLLTHLQVRQPSPSAVQHPAQDEETRRTAWQAREAEARRLQQLEDHKQREEVQRQQRAQEAAAHLVEGQSARKTQAEDAPAAQEKAALLAKDAARRTQSTLQAREPVEQQAAGRRAAAFTSPPSATTEPSRTSPLDEDAGTVPTGFSHNLLHTTRGRIALISCSLIFLVLVSFGICYFQGQRIRERVSVTSGGGIDPLVDWNDADATQPSPWPVPFRIAWLPFRIRTLRARAEDSCKQQQRTCPQVGVFDALQGNPKQAISLWQLQCDHGVGFSCTQLGYAYNSGTVTGLYPNGQAIQPNSQKAIALFQRGCTLDYVACINGGIDLVRTGQVELGIELIKSGCSKHSSGACHTLADWYSGSLVGNVRNPKPDPALAEQYQNSH